MKKLAIGLTAAAALFTATAVPAMAQVDFYAGPGGFGVELGRPGPYGYYSQPSYGYYSGVHPYGGYYDYYAGPGWVEQPGWHRHRFREW
ncbi:MAG: hypothetical protein WBF03_13755 [Xanthobacteraceae bacterium]